MPNDDLLKIYSDIAKDYMELTNKKSDIYRLLKKIIVDETKVVELAKYPREIVVEEAIKNRMYDSLVIMNKPITIDGITKIYIDVFSTNAFLREFENYRIDLQNNILPKKFVDDILNVDLEGISKIRIKDTYARAIGGTGININNAKELAVYCEPACLLPCLGLFSKNIITTSNDTTGVIDDLGMEGKCSIAIRYDLLDDNNKKIADSIVKEGNGRMSEDDDSLFIIEVPCSSSEYVGEVSIKLLNVIRKFSFQDYINDRYTAEELLNIRYLMYINKGAYNEYLNKENVTLEDLISFAKESNIPYDDEGYFWLSHASYNRHLNYLRNKKDKGTQTL